jgi:hypothetical protein
MFCGTNVCNLRDQSSAGLQGSGRKAGYDNLLLGQDYRTLPRTVLDECATMGE